MSKNESTSGHAIYQTLVELSMDGFCKIDLEGYFVEVNGVLCEMTGYSKQEFLGMHVTQLDAHEDKSLIQQRIKTTQENHSVRFETKHRTKSGIILEVEVSAYKSPEPDPFLFCFIRNITELNGARRELEFSRQKFRSIFENAPVLISISNLETEVFEEVNAKVVEVSGYSKEEIIGKSSADLNWIDEDTRQLIIKTHRENGFLKGIEIPCRRKNGEIVYCHYNGSLIDLEGKKYLLSISVDITDEKKIKEALKASEFKYRSIFENIQNVYYEVNLEGEVFEVSPSIETVSGGQYTRDDLIGRVMTDFYKDIEDRERFKELIKKYGKVVDFETKLINKDGQEIDCAITAALIFNENLQPVKIVGSMHDITRRKKAEAELNELNSYLDLIVKERTEQLLTTNKELEAFSYSVSHDLRSPLRRINGFANLLLEDFAVTLHDDAKRMLDLIAENAKNMGDLIDDLLQFSRLGKDDLDFKVIDMQSLAKSVYLQSVALSEIASIDFNLAQLPSIPGDEKMLRQVWANLIGNAVKFTSKKSERRIAIGFEETDTEVTYSIEDNGAGFDEQYQERLFGVFQRLHKASDFPGTGIGLSIVNRIVQRHGGRVSCKGKLDQGATFSFTLLKVPGR